MTELISWREQVMLQEQIINEINHIPSDKLNEFYDLIHYLRFYKLGA